jgi:mono/diheme cytochrome c family protein
MKTAMFASALVFCGAVALTAQATKANVEHGETIFKQQCAGCHGPNGKGETAMGKTFKLKDLTSADVQNMTDAQLDDIVSKGKGHMPAYGTRLGTAGVHDVVAYIRHLAKH